MKRDNVLLRRPEVSDNVRITELANNIKIAKNLKDIFPNPYSLKDADDYIDICLSEKIPLTFATIFIDEFAGMIGLVPQSDVYRKTAEVGYWIGEPFWGKGIATTALNLITDYAFNELDFHRLHTGIFENNSASMRVLEKCGYEFEGVFKDNIFKNGKFLDEHRYGKVKSKD